MMEKKSVPLLSVELETLLVHIYLHPQYPFRPYLHSPIISMLIHARKKVPVLSPETISRTGFSTEFG
jgi:hypothetical protein